MLQWRSSYYREKISTESILTIPPRVASSTFVNHVEWVCADADSVYGEEANQLTIFSSNEPDVFPISLADGGICYFKTKSHVRSLV